LRAVAVLAVGAASFAISLGYSVVDPGTAYYSYPLYLWHWTLL
jgi:hypothetical protein